MNKLRLDDLSIESFATTGEPGSRGTIVAFDDSTNWCSVPGNGQCGSETDQWTCAATCYNPHTCVNTCFPCAGGGTLNGTVTCTIQCDAENPPTEQ